MPKKSALLQALGWGFGIAVLQTVFALALAPGPAWPLTDRYLKLDNWDSLHYLDIAENGYRLSPGMLQGLPATREDVHEGKTNLEFFPGYPLSLRWLSSVLRISPQVAAPLASQLAAWGFWALIFLLLIRSGAETRRAQRISLILALHPAAFFLVTGYSEALFAFGLLGMIYWTLRGESERSPARGLFGALHGTIMSGTRLVGMPAGLFPLFHAIATRQGRLRKSVWTLIALTGGLGFFAFCQLRFGEWDLYLRLQELGWGNNPDYLAILKPASYIPRFFFEHTVDSISRSAVPATAILFGIAMIRERKTGGSPSPYRIALYATAFFLFYIPLSGKAGAKMDSMIRYSFPPQVLLMLALAELRPEGTSGRARKIILGVLYALMLAVQAWLCWRFTRGHWAA